MVADLSGGVQVWDTVSRRPLGPVRKIGSDLLSHSHDGTRLISVGDDAVRRWDIESLQPLPPAIPVGELHGGISGTGRTM